MSKEIRNFDNKGISNSEIIQHIEGSVQTRVAKPKDAEALVDLVTRGFPGYPFVDVYEVDSYKEANFENYKVQNGTDYRLVAQLNGKIVGTAVLAPWHDDSGWYMQEIKRVVVDPEYRGHGIAKELTKKLTDLAKANQIIPWLDARADQPGMQVAGLYAGHTAVSLERGKHCVYNHLDKKTLKTEVFAGRETMVHMTTLPIDFNKLANEIKLWPIKLREILAANLTTDDPPDKSPETVRKYLKSARDVKNRISMGLSQVNGDGIKVNLNEKGDASIVTAGKMKMVVVKPDASGFIISEIDSNLPKLVECGIASGLQTVTVYEDINNLKNLDLLQKAGMEPTMIRLHKISDILPTTWQVGWRRIGNGFEKSLHYINLANQIKSQINKTIGELP